MTQPIDPSAPAIGACLGCRQLFLVLPETPNCLLCGQPPAYTLFFPPAHGEPVEPPAAEPAESLPEPVPPEDLPSAADAPEPAADEEPPGEAMPSVPAPILTLVHGIEELFDGAIEDPTQLRDLFLRAGAELEEASVAIGRLAAVRDFVGELWERAEPEPTAPMEPQPETPAPEG